MAEFSGPTLLSKESRGNSSIRTIGTSMLPYDFTYPIFDTDSPTRIENFLKQLIFRNNQQEHRNKLYKNKGHAQERAGDIPAEPIDVEDSDPPASPLLQPFTKTSHR